MGRPLTVDLITHLKIYSIPHASMIDASGMNSNDPPPMLRFTETEAAVLNLYDDLRRLELELTLLRSQQSHVSTAG
jgi:hypothetical protein